MRGDGVGVEIGDHAVRAVRLHRDAPGRVAQALVVDIDPTGSPEHRLLDALIRTAQALEDIVDVPTRIAWFPPGATLQAFSVDHVDEQGLGLADELTRQGAEAQLVLSGSGRPWMLAMRWPVDTADVLADLARRAGFHDPLVEPSPVSVGRAGPPDAYMAERTSGDGLAWSSAYRLGVPMLACATHPVSDDRRTSLGPADELAIFGVAGQAVHLGELDGGLLAPNDLVAHLGHVARSRWPDGAIRPSLRAGPELDAVHVVALGASIAAAGLAGRNRVLPHPVDRVTGGGDGERELPWAIERIAATSARPSATARRWRRAMARTQQWWSARLRHRSRRAA